MTCRNLSTGGAVVFACSRSSSRSTVGCRWCGRPMAKLCDYPVKRDGVETTCGAPMCARCATAVDDKTDYCPPHERHRKKLHARGESAHG